MRVLLLFSTSEMGGAEVSLTRMALASTSGVYQLATLDGYGPWCDWVINQGKIPLVFGKRNGSKHGRLSLKVFSTLYHYIRSEKIRIIYVCGVRASFYIRILKILMPGVKLVHGIRWNPSSNSSLDRFFRIVERCSNGLVDLYITNSKIAADTMVERCAIPVDKIQVVYNGLEDMPRNLTPLYERPLNVLTVANMNPRKGYLEYLVAIEQVLNEIPNVNFFFVGRDDMNGKVQLAISERGLNDRVHCLGFKQDISIWMRSARMLVVPSLWNEGCPTSVLEAMSYGLPVVGYALDGIPELVRDKKDGLLVPIADTKHLALSIIKLLRDSELAIKMSASTLERCQAEFQLSSCVTKHRDAFEIFA
jgi:glycosyltransferase involved in cell wall biosynthesis